jgi:N-acetylneuraminic acid mutarotase
MPTARQGLAAAAVNGKLYAIGGYNRGPLATVEEYDPAANAWTAKAPMPTPRQFLAVAVGNNKIYAIGGLTTDFTAPVTTSYSSAVEEYDPATNTWTAKAPMPTARYGLAAAAQGGKIYAVGGYDDANLALGTVEVFDPATNTWAAKAPMPTARADLAAASAGGLIYAAGGAAADGTVLGTVEAYNPLTDTWAASPSMTAARAGLAAIAAGGKVFAFGGQVDVVLDAVEVWDPAAGTWASAGQPMPTARGHLAVAQANEDAYAVGGYGEDYLATVESTAMPAAPAGSVPVAAVSPTSLLFGLLLVNQTSPAQSVTLSNTGTWPLTIGSIALAGANAGDFLQTNGCGTTLAAGASCAVSVAFHPTASGARTAALTVSSDDPAHPTLTVALDGTGSALVLSTTALAFADQLRGTTSAGRSVTLTNNGAASLAITAISVTGANAGDFLLSDACGTTLAATTSCAVTLRFRPTAIGARVATLSIATADPVSPALVSLSGSGTGAVASVSPTSLAFSSTLNVATAAQTVTLTNAGSALLTINAIRLGGANPLQFSFTRTCGASLAAGATCTVSVTFRPTSAGSKSASLSVNVAAPATSQIVALAGAVLAPALAVSPTALSFGTQPLRTTTTRVVTVSNTGAAPMTVNGVSLSGQNPGQFAQTSTCVSPLAAGASCTVNVTFAPRRSGTMTARLNVNVAAPAVSQSVSLTGTGL